MSGIDRVRGCMNIPVHDAFVRVIPACSDFEVFVYGVLAGLFFSLPLVPALIRKRELTRDREKQKSGNPQHTAGAKQRQNQ